jgi:DNA-binding transcriptional LysR family regulator
MRLVTSRGVTPVDRPGVSSSPDWEHIHTFLETARRGSLRSAAEKLAVSYGSVKRRIDELERQLGTKLFTRDVEGVRLTAEGKEALAKAEQMEGAFFGLMRTKERADPFSGEVKLATTEAFGTFWLAPRLIEFQRKNPKLLVDLRCAMQSADVLRLEAHASVQLSEPKEADVKVVRLGRIHSIPTAAPSYIEMYGAPSSLDDLPNHRLALQFAEQTGTEEIYNQFYPGVPQAGWVAFRTNNSTALLWAIIKGVGIGWSPTYMHAMGPQMVPIDLDLIFSFDVWLAYHADAAQMPRVRRLLDWVRDSFDPRKYPWFRDEFIHPRDLPKEYRGPPLVNLFESAPKDPVAADVSAEAQKLQQV